MLAQIGTDLQEAAQSCATSARYLPAAADGPWSRGGVVGRGGRRLPTGVEADGIGAIRRPSRRPSHFVWSATERAARGDGAGDDHRPREEGALLFEVHDDGAGFDLATGAHHGHGFVNMSDRAGAIGGSINVESAPGRARPSAATRSPTSPTPDRLLLGVERGRG